MKTFNAVKKLGLGLALTGLFAWQAGATVSYTGVPATPPAPFTGLSEYSTPHNSIGYHTSPSGNLLGNVFDTTTSLQVIALGAYSYRGQTFGATGVNVGLYQEIGSVWTELASATFTGLFSGYSTRDTYAYQPVNLTLAAGGIYAIVASGYGTAANPYITGHTTFNALDGTVSAGGLTKVGASLPGTFSSPTFDGNMYGAGTFAVVPEATDFALAAVALLGLVYVGRLYSQKLKLA